MGGPISFIEASQNVATYWWEIKVADEKCALATEAVGSRPRWGLLPLSYTRADGEGPVSKNIGDGHLKNRTCSNRLTDISIGRSVNATIENYV